jgi:hypothetical protein
MAVPTAHFAALLITRRIELDLANWPLPRGRQGVEARDEPGVVEKRRQPMELHAP